MIALMAPEIVKHASGIGELFLNGAAIGPVRYALDFYQQTLGAGGLPVPGLERVEGSIEFDGESGGAALVGQELALLLDTGRRLGIVLASAEGRVASCAPTFHGRGCGCC